MKNWKKRTTSYCPSWTGKWKFYNKTDGDYAQRCEEELFDLQRNKQELERTLLLKDKEILLEFLYTDIFRPGYL